MSLSGDGSGNALITFGPGSQGPSAVFISNAVPVDQTASEQLQFTMSGSEALGSGTGTFTGCGTTYTGTLSEVLAEGGYTCTWNTPITLTFAGTGLTLAAPAPPAPLPPGTEVAFGGGLLRSASTATPSVTPGRTPFPRP